MAYLELRGVRKSFGATTAVNNFNLTVSRGELVSFLGPSGCGKTTTMRIIAGFEHPDEGEIWLEERALLNIPANRRNVGMVFQSYALFPHLTVRDNITFGMRLKHESRENMDKRAREMLSLIQMDALGERFPHQLSGGQQQRVALARALAMKPQVLLLDEPLSALDAKIRDELRTEIRRIQSDLNMTTIYVTHDQSEALALSDRIVVMNAGNVEQIGTPFEIYNRPGTAFVATFVGSQGTLTGVLTQARDAIETTDGLIRLKHAVAGKQAGDAVKLMLRPEMTSLSERLPGHNVLSGTVEQVMFLGSVVRISVRTGGGTIAVDQLNHPDMALPAPHAPVQVSFAPESCYVLS
jgi:putative spermidine/putrescine transport system ATP-binding protein